MATPETTTAIEVLGATKTAVALGWAAGSVEQTYRLYRDGAVVHEGTEIHYVDHGLTAATTYEYTLTCVTSSGESDGVSVIVTTNSAVVLITDRTAADVSAGRRKGFYNALDLIRVGEAMAYLEDRFADVGISVPVSPKLDWQMDDIPTQAQALHYLEDIEALRGKHLEYRETVSAPDSLTSLTWGKANDIEAILMDTEKLIQDIILSYRYYSGRVISGVLTLP